MFQKTRANKSALHPCNQFIVDKFIQLERQQQMRRATNMNFTYSKIIKSLQKYPLPILSRQQALQLENVGEKMANLIYSLIKSHYKDYLKNPNQDFEDAVCSDSDEEKKQTENNNSNRHNANSKSNSECSSKNSTNLFQKPTNSFNSKLLNREYNKDKDFEEDIPKDFNGIKNTIKNSKKQKPSAEEEELSKNKGTQKIISLLSDSEQQECKINKDNTLYNILSQYVKPETKSDLQNKLDNKQKEDNLIENLKNKYENSPIKLKSLETNEQKNNLNVSKNQENKNEDGLNINEMELNFNEKEEEEENNDNQQFNKFKKIFDEKQDYEDDAFKFQNDILNSFKLNSKNKLQRQQTNSSNGGMKKIQIDSDQESTLPQNKESSSSSKKSSVKPQNGNISFLSEEEDLKVIQTLQDSQNKKKRKFNPKEYTNNWAILICLYCLKEEFKKNSASIKDIKQKAKSISEEIDHQFQIKNFNQTDSLLNNDLIIVQLVQGEKILSLTSTGIELSQSLYHKLVAKSLAGIQENSQENANSQQKQYDLNQSQNQSIMEVEDQYVEQYEIKKIESQQPKKIEQYEKMKLEQYETKKREKYDTEEIDKKLNNQNSRLQNEFDDYMDKLDCDSNFNNILDFLEKSEQPINYSRSKTAFLSSNPESLSSKMGSIYNPQNNKIKFEKFEENFSDRNSDYDERIKELDQFNSQFPLPVQNSKKNKGTKKEKKVIEPLQQRNIFKEQKIKQLQEIEDDDIENEAINNSLPFSSNRSIPNQLSLGIKQSNVSQKIVEKISLNKIAKGMIKEYEVYLIIDIRERTDKNERDLAIKQKLEENGVCCKIENIYLGDFLWVVDITTIDNVTETYVLDYVVERKTGDDFASSIQDHRYKEQKYRYKKSGLKHCYYLVEGDIKNTKHLSVSQSAIETAIMTTQMIDKFKVQRTKSFQESMIWISCLHKNILKHFNEYISSINDDHILNFQYTMSEYQKNNKKNGNLTLKEQFGHFLRSINGCGAQQVQVLTEIFQTPINLISNLGSQRNLQERIELIIDQTKYNKNQLKAQGMDARVISKSLATSIAILFGEDKYPKEKLEDGA
ncbi:ERCC4 domain protein (macronuclear) [Tetrahymena thermophila SB210]|uniref:Crossover junction endonuclease MUS81 n=1 Tax=Tetrahymena thermophila (strain SB210) TaxID=312017 RepID=Q240P5_TETTS|nr:ERCC4 domain protein [Tetrahymena thermophila SB210]EAS02369.2 ERCC4 domain protein [Tetrahymena thermophila SB210]|eukprot:XP_001022614.2 ERCC4 domain protein [Tetrahymena thermophila SB210]